MSDSQDLIGKIAPEDAVRDAIHVAIRMRLLSSLADKKRK